MCTAFYLPQDSAEVQGSMVGALWELARHGFDDLVFDNEGVQIVLQVAIQFSSVHYDAPSIEHTAYSPDQLT